MNRRSLLLGGVVASVAGILGVKARPVEVVATPTSTEIRTPWVDGRDTIIKVEKPVYFTGKPYPYETPDLDIIINGEGFRLNPTPRYWYSINPDFSDLRAALPIDGDTDS